MQTYYIHILTVKKAESGMQKPEMNPSDEHWGNDVALSLEPR